jgi:hypothetical protein
MAIKSVVTTRPTEVVGNSSRLRVEDTPRQTRARGAAGPRDREGARLEMVTHDTSAQVDASHSAACACDATQRTHGPVPWLLRLLLFVVNYDTVSTPFAARFRSTKLGRSEQ